MSKPLGCVFAVLFLVLPRVDPACADVRLPKIFGDGMVLQREKPIAVWGWADPGESVTVSFAEQTTTTAANGDGRWRIELPP